ncbi:acylphosphatase [Pontibacter arcticus]|uniref:Acylphosphatase n=1 Tax=Pontibacter arcticus TaxID=2080288 RepID=A0A364RJX5_9BACT|nr:acylphosphatase [Pontibacter arcticus]RAU84548.1 acylphosphatase [Pontibacter arcticus]
MENSEKKRISIRVHGKVQGVFFRASTQEKARELGLAGFVQNEPDGTVYLEAEGEPDALQKLKEWAQEGPIHARVENLEVQELEGVGVFDTFEQRR